MPYQNRRSNRGPEQGLSSQRLSQGASISEVWEALYDVVSNRTGIPNRDALCYRLLGFTTQMEDIGTEPIPFASTEITEQKEIITNWFKIAIRDLPENLRILFGTDGTARAEELQLYLLRHLKQSPFAKALINAIDSNYGSYKSNLQRKYSKETSPLLSVPPPSRDPAHDKHWAQFVKNLLTYAAPYEGFNWYGVARESTGQPYIPHRERAQIQAELDSGERNAWSSRDNSRMGRWTAFAQAVRETDLNIFEPSDARVASLIALSWALSDIWNRMMDPLQAPHSDLKTYSKKNIRPSLQEFESLEAFLDKRLNLGKVLANFGFLTNVSRRCATLEKKVYPEGLSELDKVIVNTYLYPPTVRPNFAESGATNMAFEVTTSFLTAYFAALKKEDLQEKREAIAELQSTLLALWACIPAVLPPWAINKFSLPTGKSQFPGSEYLFAAQAGLASPQTAALELSRREGERKPPRLMRLERFENCFASPDGPIKALSGLSGAVDKAVVDQASEKVRSYFQDEGKNVLVGVRREIDKPLEESAEERRKRQEKALETATAADGKVLKVAGSNELFLVTRFAKGGGERIEAAALFEHSGRQVFTATGRISAFGYFEYSPEALDYPFDLGPALTIQSNSKEIIDGWVDKARQVLTDDAKSILRLFYLYEEEGLILRQGRMSILLGGGKPYNEISGEVVARTKEAINLLENANLIRRKVGGYAVAGVTRYLPEIREPFDDLEDVRHDLLECDGSIKASLIGMPKLWDMIYFVNRSQSEVGISPVELLFDWIKLKPEERPAYLNALRSCDLFNLEEDDKSITFTEKGDYLRGIFGPRLGCRIRNQVTLISKNLLGTDAFPDRDSLSGINTLQRVMMNSRTDPPGTALFDPPDLLERDQLKNYLNIDGQRFCLNEQGMQLLEENVKVVSVDAFFGSQIAGVINGDWIIFNRDYL